MHAFHQILLDVMECNAFGGTMVDVPFHIYAAIGVPIVFGVLWGSVRQVMTWLERHVAFPSGFVLGVIRQNVHLSTHHTYNKV